MIDDIRRALRESANAQDAKFLQGFFRTGPGEYGEGDRFLGVRVPATRKVAKKFADTPLSEVLQLLHSEWHEERFLALLLLVRMYERGDQNTRRTVYDAYLSNTKYINNWDLVDSSAGHIVGAYLFEHGGAPKTLGKLARSKMLWERRIAMLSTSYFIGKNSFDVPLQIAERLLADPEDLIHKATGWMLREIGQRDMAVLKTYLEPRVLQMPRTMLRYAIEKFPERERQRILKRRV